MSADMTGTDIVTIITAITGAVTTILAYIFGHKKGRKAEQKSPSLPSPSGRTNAESAKK